jgi:hypothetical protein
MFDREKIGAFMTWLLEIDTELGRIRPGQNAGKIRTTARRIAGIALRKLYGSPSDNFLQQLQTAMNDDALPDEIREASERLAARLDTNFSSPSVDPVGDAMLIVAHVKHMTT